MCHQQKGSSPTSCHTGALQDSILTSVTPLRQSHGHPVSRHSLPALTTAGPSSFQLLCCSTVVSPILKEASFKKLSQLWSMIHSPKPL